VKGDCETSEVYITTTTDIIATIRTLLVTGVFQLKRSWKLTGVPLRGHTNMGSVVGKITEEQPKYDVTETKEGEYETRLYAPSIAIETTQGISEKDGKPFMKLAGYIGVRSTPQNKEQQAISMTAPVVNVKPQEGDTGDRMQFVLPSSLTSPPEPTEGSDVTVVHRSSKLMAVRTFMGGWSESLFESERDKLLELLQRDGVDIVKPMYLEVYRYNPPWTISSMRTNEVAVELVTVSPETVSPETVSPETVSPETVSPETVSPETVSPETQD